MPTDRWTREQTIIALRTYFIVPFNKASDSNQEIISIAKIIGRKVSAVKMKIGNFGSLDPELAKRGIVGLSGASKLDKEIWNEYASNRELLAFESAKLLSQYSHQKIEDTIELPDFDILEGEDKHRFVKTRVNQKFFRESILGIYHNTCCITGIDNPKLLVASHIIPWAKDKENRLNPENGICLNSIHDKAFDQGLITITPDYKVKLSRKLLQSQHQDSIQKFFKDYEDANIIMPDRYFPNTEFLEYHNKHIFIH
ncbi:MAG: HNH endonuclease [Candidatus Kapaibacterium sp.]